MTKRAPKPKPNAHTIRDDRVAHWAVVEWTGDAWRYTTEKRAPRLFQIKHYADAFARFHTAGDRRERRVVRAKLGVVR